MDIALYFSLSLNIGLLFACYRLFDQTDKMRGVIRKLLNMPDNE